MPGVSCKFLAVAGACLLLAGCAQTGPPLPPSLELPRPPADLRATRKGNTVTLVWSEPIRTTDRQSVRYLGPTQICRAFAADVAACGTPIGEVAAQPASGSATPASRTFVDTLPAALLEQNAAADITYAVEVLNRDRRGAGISNRVAIAAVPTLPPPADFHAELTGSGVVFTWTGRDDQPPAGVQFRYRIYRRDGTGKETLAAEVPSGAISPLHAEDSGFEWEKTYRYRLTSVSIVARPGGDAQVEGDDTAAIEIVAHDVFPPAVPSGLQAVYSGEGQKPFIDLIWAPVTDADLAGYNVYRHEANVAPIRINSEPVKTPSYRDAAVTAGRSYVYAVSAVDVRGNESARSEEAGESAP